MLRRIFEGCTGNEKNIIYLNLGRGVAIGIIVDGKIYYGRSGFAGEFGHTPFFENEIICDCGKKGVWRPKYRASPSRTR